MKEQLAKLIDSFTDAAKKHQNAATTNSRKANTQARRIHKIFCEIVEIGDEAREALLQLTDNSDDAVASMAAVYSLNYDTEKSVATLKRIAQKPGLIGFEARQAIQRWKECTWQLE